MKILPLVMTAVLGYGCAAKRLAARNADLFVEHQIEKRMSLYSAQKKILSLDVNQLLNDQKHTVKEALPAISKIELDANKIDQQYDYLNIVYKNLSFSFSKLMSKHMAMLDKKQQAEFKKTLEDENKVLARTELSDRMDKVYDNFEMLFGSMSETQKKIFKDESTYIKQRNNLRLDRRKKLHQRFFAIYQLDLSNEARANSFIEAFSEYQDDYPDSAKNKEIIKKIMPTLTKEQKKVFKEKTNDLKEIIGYYLETNY